MNHDIEGWPLPAYFAIPFKQIHVAFRGVAGLAHHDDIIHIVGDFEKDEEGFYWRSFHPQCWKRLKLDEYSAEDIYNKYPPAPVA
jgi:hypothetical protein